MKEYYTYAYLREDGTPYYIGKGKENRINDYHTKFVKLPPKDRRLILKQNMSEEDAFKHEIYMIGVFGRKDLGTGILINRTNGGDKPPICTSVSEETRKKISDSRKGKSLNYDVWNKGKSCSEEIKKRISESKRGSKHSEETKQKMRDKRQKYLYILIDPMNIEYEVKNISQFCKVKNLHQSSIVKVSRGIRKHHKGWKATREPLSLTVDSRTPLD